MKRLSILFTSLLLAIGMQAQDLSLKDELGKHFLIGCAIDTTFLWGHLPDEAYQLVDKQFNAVVAENCMKGENIHPEKDRFYWDDADLFVDWSTKHGMAIVGHCLVWHSQPPKWMFTYENGDTVSREVLIGRMYHHINTIVSRYKDRIHRWDVVNEAILDDGTLRQSPYYKIIGPEFIELAFQFAHEADPTAELYYNDYSMAGPAKRERVCQLVRDLKSKGLRIDAIGMQSHNGYNYPDLTEYEKSIEAFAACGVKVQITELDVNMLPNPASFGGADINQKYAFDKKMNPYANGLDKKAQKLFNERYLAMFEIYKRHKDVIDRVGFWGINDSNTWLNDWPIKGRTNYPTLFDRNYKAKPVLKEIIELFKK